MGYIAATNLGNTAYVVEVTLALRERLLALRHLIPPVIIYFVVMGSIYFGIATPTESAALGIAWHAGALSFDFLHRCFVHTARTTGMVLLIITGAFILNVTLALVGVAQTMTEWVASLGLSPTGLLLALILLPELALRLPRTMIGP